jgi:hypothetical protein
MTPGTGFDLARRSPLNVVQLPAKAISGRSQRTSVSSSQDSGLERFRDANGMRQRLAASASHASEATMCSGVGLWRLSAGNAMPERIISNSVPLSALRTMGQDNQERRPAWALDCRRRQSVRLFGNFGNLRNAALI